MGTLSNTKRWLFVALLAACVPTEEEKDPRGGVVARLVPSAETSGRPFQSTDGWTITIEKFAMRAGIVAERHSGANSSFIGGYGQPRIVTPSESCELRAVAISVGPIEATLELISGFGGGYLGEPREPATAFCNVDPELVPYFDRKADSPNYAYEDGFPDPYRNTPSIVLLGRAEKNGRTIRLELVLDATTYGSSEGHGVATNVVADQGALVRLGVDAAALFRATGPGAGKVPFDRVAAADTNGDGVVTGAELAVTDVVCEDVEDFDALEYCGTILERWDPLESTCRHASLSIL